MDWKKGESVQIVVNHLTRMKQGYFCVAGLDLKTGKHVRPVLPGQQLSTRLLARNGGPFDIGVIVDLGTVAPNPQPPEVEDCIFSTATAKKIATATPNEFWKKLESVARPQLKDIFGPALKIRETTYGMFCVVDPGQGYASLGCLTPNMRPSLDLHHRYKWGKPDEIRMRVSDGNFGLNLPVTDIRLYGDDHVTPEPNVINRVAEILQGTDDFILSVGLTRPFAPKTSHGFSRKVHWLQVNNIHLKDNPLWQLG